MKPLLGKDLAQILERHGWKLLRIKGNHFIYYNYGSIVRLSIPIHGNTTLKIALLKHLMKMAGFTEKDLT